LYYADPLGDAIKTVADGLVYPNGMGLSPDGGKLYVSETYTGHVFCWDIAAPGHLENRTLLYSTGGAHNWDGLAVDGAGNICISNLQKSGITALSPAGHVLWEFATPEYDPYITNICFGGSNGNTAYVCSAGRGILYSLPWPWPGLRLNYAR
jgi:gluconolactonase